MRYLEQKHVPRWALASLVALVLGVLTGCSSSLSAPGTPHDAGSVGTRGGLRITVEWPTQTRVIPPDTTKIVVQVLGIGLTAPVSGEIVHPNTSLTIDNLPTGNKTISAIAVNDHDAQTAMGTTTVVIANGQFVDADITMSIDAMSVYAEIEAAVDKLLLAKDATSPANAKTHADTALAYLDDALTKAIPRGPAANKANFYWALAKLASVAAEMGIEWQPPTTAQAMTRQSPWLVPDPVAMAANTGRMRSLTDVVNIVDAATISSALVPTRSIANTRQGTTTSDPSATYKKAYADLTEQVIPAFTAVDTHLATLAVEKLALVLENPLLPNDPTANMVVDYGDVCALRAVFKLMLATLEEAIAYDLDPGTFDFDAEPATLDLNTDNRLTPTEYLPAAPFATLRPTGATTLTSVYANACGAVDLLHASATFHLQPGQLQAAGEIMAPVSPQTFAQVRDLTARLKLALTMPTVLSPWMTGMKQDLKIDLAKHWQAPLTDLRVLLPDQRIVTITETYGSYQETHADLTAIDDKTAGGLFPNGLPNEIIYQNWDPASLFGDIDLVVK